MTPVITDTTKNPILINSGATVNPFTSIAIDDPLVFGPYNSPESGRGIISIALTPENGATGSLGTLSQASYPGLATFDPSTNTLTEMSNVAPTDPTTPDTILGGTLFTAPVVGQGQTKYIDANVTYTHVGGETVADSTPVVFEVLGLPAPTVTGPSAAASELNQSQTYTPFPYVVVTEPASDTALPETVTVRLGTVGPQNPYPFSPNPNFIGGTITDPMGGGSFDPATNSFTEITQDVPGQPDGAQAIINRLVYTPPTLAAGSGREVGIEVSVNNSDGATGTLPLSPHGFTTYVQDVTNPLVMAGPAQSAVAGTTITPFAGLTLADNGILYLGSTAGGANNTVSARIVITDGGTATDADGILSGSGLTKTDVGTYTLAAANVYGVASELQHLTYATTAVEPNGSRTDVFNLTVTDPTTKLSTANSATSVTSYGPSVFGTTPVSIGTGPDALVLQISEDAYQGSAMFTISIDGAQYGGTQTATAMHGAGQEQPFTIHGDFGASAHSVTVNFLNDNGGYGPTDRNLHVDGATINGAAIPNSSLTEYVSGPRTIDFTGNPATTSDAPVVIGSGPDTFLFAISEDAYQGNAQFTLSIDGQQQGGTQAAIVSHGTGQTETFAVEGNFGSGAHTATVNFLNDAYAGTPDTDRNLYVQGVSYNGVPSTDGSATLLSAGPVNFATAASPAAPQATPDTLTIGLTEDAYQGDAMASIAIDGHNLGTPTITYLNSSGTAEDFTYTGNFGGTAALQTLQVSFLNDNGGYGATDRNLYVKDVSFNGTALPDTSTLYTGGTVATTFQNNSVISPFPNQH